MLSKEQKSELNQNFWAELKRIMNAHKSSNGRSINWLNYPSDVKGIYIRMQVDNNSARLCFDMQYKDDGIRAIVWEQMGELKKVLESKMTSETFWVQELYANEGFHFSRIFWELENVSLFNEEDHSRIYNFLRIQLLSFDSFYQEFKDILINLVH
jgi:hypothetical protein